VWAYLDVESDVYNSYVLASQGVSLYTLALPTYTHAPVASALVDAPEGAADGDNWVIEIPLREGLVWSDGEPVTANDWVFTFNVVKDLGLGGNFTEAWPIAAEDDPATEDENEFRLGLVSVEAPDDQTLVLTWNDQPGLATWQFGTAFAPAFPEHYWADIVAGAAEAGDLYAVSALGAPSFGPDIVAEREPGAFVRNVVNENYSYKGATYTVYANGAIEFSHPVLGSETWGGDPSGEVLVEYTEGPFISDMLFNVYGSQDAAALALIEGDIDYWLNPLSLSRGLQGQFLAAEDLNVVANAGTGMFYMAFNTRRFPGNSVEFRRAADCMIDKEFVAENVLAGAVIPMDSTVAPGNAFWSNPDVKATCAGMSQEDRLNTAVQILEDAGWTWEEKPEFLGGRDDVKAGVGLTGPDGTRVQPIDLIAPGPGYDPMRATYSLWIQNFLNDLGVPVTANPTGFTTIVDQVFGPVDWDMYILGWGLGTFPDYMGAFFHSASDSAEGGFNTTGYSNPEFDALSDAFDAATDIDEARKLHFQMQEIIARDAPYVVLFTNVQFDVFRNTLEFPFTEFLQGITDGGAGLRSLVKTAQ
jgi:ABC-type transport system substrate-binding protein